MAQNTTADEGTHIQTIIDGSEGTPLEYDDHQVENQGRTHDVFFDIRGEPVCVGYDTDHERWHVMSGRLDVPGPESDHEVLERAIKAAERYDETFAEYMEEEGLAEDDVPGKPTH